MQQTLYVFFSIGVLWSLVEGKPFRDWLTGSHTGDKKGFFDMEDFDGLLDRSTRHAAGGVSSMELIELPWIACKDRSRASGYCANEGKCEERFVPMRRQGQKHYKVEELFRCVCKDGFTGVRCEITSII